MRRQDQYLLLGVAVVIAVMSASTFESRLIGVVSDFLPSVEGFSSQPYWDVNRYSWGYGTAAPGSTGTITRAEAAAEMIAYFLRDYRLLKQRVMRNLTVRQWAALLSFSYNVGVGNAYNLLPNINSGNDTALGAQWRMYIKSGGVVNQVLVGRREKEWVLWNS